MTISRQFIDLVVSWLVFALFATMIGFKVQLMFATQNWLLAPIILYWTLAAVLLVIRKPSKEASNSPLHWVVANTIFVLPFAIQPQSHSVIWLNQAGLVLSLASTVFLIVAFATLGRSFGIIAARREVKTHGVYQWVRHPIYSADFFLGLSTLMLYPLLWNVAIFVIITSCQVLRMNEEERILSNDPAYVDYKNQVRYRWMPGVY